MNPAAAPAEDATADPGERYLEVRRTTEDLCAPLSPEDAAVQSMPDASPAKWHLAHTTWYFETFVLEQAEAAFEPFDPAYRVLFNSYYNTVGRQHPRPRRGLLTRPALEEVRAYRRQVDARMQALLADPGRLPADLHDLVELGIQHEQQHQELILMDVKHLFSCSPLQPAYHAPPETPARAAPALEWLEYAGGEYPVGAAPAGFAFDNERPRHRARLEDFALAARPVTNGEFLAFIEDGGYCRPELWLADGWATVQAEAWAHPRYWQRRDGQWQEFTLAGPRALDPHAPACHISYYEADAYATWAGARLPDEQEWEHAAGDLPVAGNLMESGRLHPVPAEAHTAGRPAQMFGDVWEWTRSAYAPYPGYRPPAGAVGEYNGKFMCNQYVLRGGACVTPASHVRATYRNFFYPHTHWHFSGVRLARD